MTDWTHNNNNNNKDLTSVSSSRDDVRDVPTAYITTNRFTQNDLKRYMPEKRNNKNDNNNEKYKRSKKQCQSGDQNTVRGGIEIYGGKRCVLSLLQKVEIEEQERRSRDKRFQIVGAGHKQRSVYQWRCEFGDFEQVGV